MEKFEFRYVIGFEDTNLVGNVYFANFVRWQGKCREMFLKEKVPDILNDIQNYRLALITLNCSCNFIGELAAFDEVIILMSLSEIYFNKIVMSFEYFKNEATPPQIVATGVHEIGCFKRINGQLQPLEIPEKLLTVLQTYK